MKLNIKQLWQDKFVQGTFWLTAANFIGSFLAYLVHPILTRHLSVAAYGDFQALLSFATVFGIIGVVISMTLIKEVSVLAVKHPEEIGLLRRRAAARLFFLGLAIFILILSFIGPLNRLFKITEPFILLIASVNLVYNFPLVVNRAVLTGLQKFSALSLSNLLDSFFRLFLIIILVILWPWQLVGAAWSLGLAGLAAFLLSFWQIKNLKLPAVSPPVKTDGSLRTLWRYAWLVLWFTVLIQFFYNFDMLFVKSFFSPEEAGLYGALLTIGRIVFFIGSSIPLVMFPVIAGLRDDASPRKYLVLVKSLGLMSLLAIPTAAFISIFPQFVIKFVVGVKYLALVPYLPVFAWVIFGLTLLTVISQYFLALSRRSGLVVLTLGAIAEAIIVNFFHTDLWQVIWSLALVFGSISLILLGLCFRDYLVSRKNYVRTDR